MIFDMEKVVLHKAALGDHYQALLLRSLNRKYQQIAATLNIPNGTVKSRIHRGTQLLKKALLENENT